MQHSEQKNQSPSNIITREVTYSSKTKTVSKAVSMRNRISKDAWLYIFDLDNTLVAENESNDLMDYMYSEGIESISEQRAKAKLDKHKKGLWDVVEKKPLHGEAKDILECLNGIQKNGDIVSFFSSTDYVDIYEKTLIQRVGLKDCDFLKFDVSSWNEDGTPNEFTLEINQDAKDPKANLIVMVTGFPFEVGVKKTTNKREHIRILEILLAQLEFNLEKSPGNEMVCDDNPHECALAKADGRGVIQAELSSKAKSDKGKGLGAHFKEMLEHSDKRHLQSLNSSANAGLSELKAEESKHHEKSNQAALNGVGGYSQQVSKSSAVNGHHDQVFNPSGYSDSDTQMSDANSSTIAKPTVRSLNQSITGSSSANVSQRLVADGNRHENGKQAAEEQKKQTSPTSQNKESSRNSDQSTASSSSAALSSLAVEESGVSGNRKRKMHSEGDSGSQDASKNGTVDEEKNESKNNCSNLISNGDDDTQMSDAGNENQKVPSNGNSHSSAAAAPNTSPDKVTEPLLKRPRI